MGNNLFLINLIKTFLIIIGMWIYMEYFSNKIIEIINEKFAFSEQNEINSQQIKKDDNLMGKSSGDTKIESGSKNHLKDFQSDNQSADKLFANQKQDEVKKDE